MVVLVHLIGTMRSETNIPFDSLNGDVFVVNLYYKNI